MEYAKYFDKILVNDNLNKALMEAEVLLNNFLNVGEQ
jgi:guanylate kinase